MIKKISWLFMISIISIILSSCSNHFHSYIDEVIEPTCTTQGYTNHTCSCGKTVKDNYTNVIEHIYDEWVILTEATINKTGLQEKKCLLCGHTIKEIIPKISHEHIFVTETFNETCTERGYTEYTCSCGFNYQNDYVEASGHKYNHIVILNEPTDTKVGKRNIICSVCNELQKTQNYVDNNYLYNGKLSVVGPDLVNQYGDKIQLYGLSTHGIQWFGRFINFNTISEIQEEFGNNIIRFAFYTDEDGYCIGSSERKKQMLKDLERGIEIATALGLYVIVDWHMVGANNVKDKNPLTYLEESKEFFSYISEKYQDHDNILYEIMNEPNGSTTWDDCKKYANEVIPCIRKNTNAIILVGNPRWTADLTSVMASPLVGYTNIMYTYHFYAADHSRTTQVETAYDAGFPVFISEFGFMYSDGDGAISTKNGEKWKQVLDSRNISYVAWNISNSKGSASIFKTSTTDHADLSDDNLKTWGIYLKNWYKEKSGLDHLSE